MEVAIAKRSGRILEHIDESPTRSEYIAQQLSEYILLRVCMPEVLAKSFRIPYSGESSSSNDQRFIDSTYSSIHAGRVAIVAGCDDTPASPT
jgi:hypothetical protein